MTNFHWPVICLANENSPSSRYKYEILCLLNRQQRQKRNAIKHYHFAICQRLSSFSQLSLSAAALLMQLRTMQSLFSITVRRLWWTNIIRYVWFKLSWNVWIDAVRWFSLWLWYGRRNVLGLRHGRRHVSSRLPERRLSNQAKDQVGMGSSERWLSLKDKVQGETDRRRLSASLLSNLLRTSAFIREFTSTGTVRIKWTYLWLIRQWSSVRSAAVRWLWPIPVLFWTQRLSSVRFPTKLQLVNKTCE